MNRDGQPSATGRKTGRFDHSDRFLVAPKEGGELKRAVHLAGWVVYAFAGLGSIVLVGSLLGSGSSSMTVAQALTFAWSTVAFGAVTAPASARRLLRWPLLPRVGTEPSRSADLDELARNLFGQAVVGVIVPVVIIACLLAESSTAGLVMLIAATVGYVAMLGAIAFEIRTHLVSEPPPVLPVRVHFGDETLAGWAIDHVHIEDEWFTLIEWAGGRNWIRSARTHKPFGSAVAVWFERSEVTEQHRKIASIIGIEILPPNRIAHDEVD